MADSHEDPNDLDRKRSTAAHAGPEHRCGLTPKEFAERTGLSPATVQRYLADGRLPKYQPGGKRSRVLIPWHALDGLILTVQSSDRSDDKPTSKPDADTKPPGMPGPRPRWQRRRP